MTKQRRTSRSAGDDTAPMAGAEKAATALAKAPEQVARRSSGRTRKQPVELLSGLGLHGLSSLDAPVLAALAAQTPMLLIGPHGSAKSALLERLALALGLEHRNYNASLLSFDDLVGFPVPDGDGLKYLRTPATLWEAQSIFLDEISRCRPEVQNKLFSIVHEKRVQGIALEALRYRWAAMNPPAGQDPADAFDTGDDANVYTGSLPLDPALADRFGFLLRLPALDELAPEARRDVIRSGLAVPRALHGAQAESGIASTAVDVPALVADCRQRSADCADRHGEWITAYTAALVVPLRQAGLGISGRRSAMLAANITGVHGARGALGQYTAGPKNHDGEVLADSALAALRHSLPHAAQGRPVDAGIVMTVHRQAVDAAAQVHVDTVLADILDEAHPVRRVGKALAAIRKTPGRVPKHTMSLLVADALASQDKQARWVLGQELLPALAGLDCVDAPTLELLAEPFTAQVGFEERVNLLHQVRRDRMSVFNALVAAVETLDADDPQQAALANLGVALYTRDENACEPAALVRQQHVLRALLDAAAEAAR